MPKSTSSSATDNPELATPVDTLLLQRLGTLGLLYGASRWLIHDFLFPYTSAFAASGSAALFLGVVTAAALFYLPRRVAAYFYISSMTVTGCLSLVTRGVSTLEPGHILLAAMASIVFLPSKEARLAILTQITLLAACALYLSLSPMRDAMIEAMQITITRESAPWLNAATVTYLCLALTLLASNFGLALSNKLALQQSALDKSQKELQTELKTIGNLYRYLNRDVLIIDAKGIIVAASSQLLAKLQLLEQEIVGTPVERWFERTPTSSTHAFNRKTEIVFKPNPSLGTLLWTTKSNDTSITERATIAELQFPSTYTPSHNGVLVLSPPQALAAFQDHIDKSIEECEARYFVSLRPQLQADTNVTRSETEVMAFMRECALVLRNLWPHQILLLDQSILVVVFPPKTEVNQHDLSLTQQTLDHYWNEHPNLMPPPIRLEVLTSPIMGCAAEAFLDPTDTRPSPDDIQLRKRVLEQFRDRGFAMHLQPVMALRKETSSLFYEALARWLGPDPIPPPVFLAAAKNMGLEAIATKVLFSLFCHAAEDLIKANPESTHRLSFNIDAENFTDATILAFMKSRLRNSALHASQVIIELLETHKAQDIEQLNTTIAEAKAWGATIAIDDFGKSFSSLERLITTDANIFKLDGALTDRIDESKIATLVNHIAHLATKLDMVVVAEGIETKEQLETLQALGVEYGQGYYLSRPAPPHSFAHKELPS
jgi:EAL domain-containing protein (putative c-di-GMP-specific phosphodiesterase class I)